MYYVYKILNKEDEVIYVGCTNNVAKRVKEHLIQEYKPKEFYTEIHNVKFSEFSTIVEARYFEGLLISCIKPKYNKTYSDANFKTNPIELEWKDYELESNHDVFIEKKQNINKNKFNLEIKGYVSIPIELFKFFNDISIMEFRLWLLMNTVKELTVESMTYKDKMWVCKDSRHYKKIEEMYENVKKLNISNSDIIKVKFSEIQDVKSIRHLFFKCVQSNKGKLSIDKKYFKLLFGNSSSTMRKNFTSCNKSLGMSYNYIEEKHVFNIYEINKEDN